MFIFCNIAQHSLRQSRVTHTSTIASQEKLPILLKLHGSINLRFCRSTGAASSLVSPRADFAVTDLAADRNLHANHLRYRPV